MRKLAFALAVAGCGAAKPAVGPTATPTPATGVATPRPVTVELLCGALEECKHKPGMCGHQIGLNIWREDAGWATKVVMSRDDEAVEAVIDLDAGTCDGTPVKIPNIDGANIDTMIARVRVCALGPPWNGKTANGPISFDDPVISRFAMADGRHQLYSVDLSDGSDKRLGINIDPVTGKCTEFRVMPWD